MNILVIRNSLYVGGAELYYTKLNHAVSKSQLSLKLILITNNTNLFNKAASVGIDTHYVDIFNEEVGTKRGLLRLLYILPQYVLLYIKKILQIKRKSKIDVALLSGTTEKLALTFIFRLMHIPVVWLEHGRVFRTTRSKFVRILYIFLGFFTNKILAEAHDVVDDLQMVHSLRKKISYIGSGVDTNYFSQKSNIHRSVLTIGFIASVSWEKGIREFLDTILCVYRLNKNIKFIIVGDGPQLQYAKEFITNQNLQHKVTITGYQNNTKNYLAKIQILLSPIHHPGGLSLSVQEAMSMGVVPIVTDMGGNKELVIHNSNGFIVRNNFPDNASVIINMLLNDRNTLKKMSNSARKFILQNYTEDQWVNSLYNNLTPIVRSNP